MLLQPTVVMMHLHLAPAALVYILSPWHRHASRRITRCSLPADLQSRSPHPPRPPALALREGISFVRLLIAPLVRHVPEKAPGRGDQSDKNGSSGLTPFVCVGGDGRTGSCLYDGLCVAICPCQYNRTQRHSYVAEIITSKLPTHQTVAALHQVGSSTVASENSGSHGPRRKLTRCQKSQRAQLGPRKKSTHGPIYRPCLSLPANPDGRDWLCCSLTEKGKHHVNILMEFQTLLN